MTATPRRRTHESSSAGDVTYTWNSLGQLTGIASEDATSTYEYGPTGMREKLTVVSAEATTTTECVWSGGTLVASRVSETQGGTTTVTDYRYLYGPDSLPLELIVTPLGGTPSAYTFQCDARGSVIALTDATGAAVATYTYDPWGALVEAPTTGIGARNPLRYRGYYFDDATGVYYLPARYYDPQTARFLSPDPAPPSAGDPLSLNRYAYCVGDPVNADDPSGASLVCDGGGRTLTSDEMGVFSAFVSGGSSYDDAYYISTGVRRGAVSDGAEEWRHRLCAVSSMLGQRQRAEAHARAYGLPYRRLQGIGLPFGDSRQVLGWRSVTDVPWYGVTRPDFVDSTTMGVSAVADFHPVGRVAAGVMDVIVLGTHTRNGVLAGTKSEADFGIGVAGFVPGFSLCIFAAYGVFDLVERDFGIQMYTNPTTTDVPYLEYRG